MRAFVSRFRLLAFVALVAASPAGAQVIEIAEDGQATTYAGPTRFVSEGPEQLIASPVAAPRIDPFEQAARTHHVDVRLLRAVAYTESRGNNRAVSPKGALGVMQLMPGTARELGVDPADESANIAGGAAYLARQLGRFGDVPLALAAYNAGPGAVERWRGIPPYAETQAYVASIMRRWGGPAKAPVAPAKPAAPIPNPALTMLIEVPTP